jgi:hypothetical protein
MRRVDSLLKKVAGGSRTCFRRLPLFGALASCSMRDHGDAVMEFLSTCFLSLSPLLVAWLVGYFHDHQTTFWGNIKANTNNGELFLYAASFLSPIFFTVMRKRKEEYVFPSKTSHILVYSVLFAVVVLVFGLQRTGSFVFDPISLSQAQYCVFGASLILFYLVLVYNNSLYPNPADTMRSEEEEFTEAVRNHREA